MMRLLRSRRRWMMLALDLVVLAIAYYASFVLRLDGLSLGSSFSVFVSTLPLAIAGGCVGMYLAGVYRGLWRYVSLKDLMRIVRGTLYATALLVVAVWLVHGFTGFPRAVFGINALLVVLGTSGVRVRAFPPRAASRCGRSLSVRGTRPTTWCANCSRISGSC